MIIALRQSYSILTHTFLLRPNPAGLHWLLRWFLMMFDKGQLPNRPLPCYWPNEL